MCPQATFSFSWHTTSHTVCLFLHVLCIAHPSFTAYHLSPCPVEAVVRFFYCFFWERRLRWHSFQISHRLSHSIASLHISNQSAAQLNLLQKFSLLRLTAIMEKYSMSNKHGWTWWVPLITGKEIVSPYFGVLVVNPVMQLGTGTDFSCRIWNCPL